MEQMEGNEAFQHLIERPVSRRKVGIVRLEMIREEKSLYGMGRFLNPKEAVEMVLPLVEHLDREVFLVVSLDSLLAPVALEIAAVGGVSFCAVDVKSVFKHALLNNASYVLCLHNHPSGNPEPSLEDEKVTKRIFEAGSLLGISLTDHIIIGSGSFYSFREHKKIIHDTGRDM